jgi:hypothetical protein
MDLKMKAGTASLGLIGIRTSELSADFDETSRMGRDFPLKKQPRAADIWF